MKQIAYLLLAAIGLPVWTLAQSGEFTVYSNGLIYNDTTMQSLFLIVDSLNLKYRQCSLNRIYESRTQARAHHFETDSAALGAEITVLLQSNIPFETLISRYPQLNIKFDALTILKESLDKQGQYKVSVTEIPIDYGYENGITVLQPGFATLNQFEGGYLFESGPDGLEGYYFPEKPTSTIIPEPYARMIQYVDCLIDTTTNIFPTDRSDWYNTGEQPKAIASFLKLVNDYPGRPKMPGFRRGEEKWETYYQDKHIWDSLRLEWEQTTLSQTTAFAKALEEAVSAALEYGESDEVLEEYVARYYSKEIALELKRQRPVVGACSMDERPREQARQIAVLSAETLKWDIFLRAHLNIMNDHVARVSDGSWAWEGRQTYIRELEELGINVPDLLIGSCLRARSTSPNHYLGDINRIGRAITESRDLDRFISTISSMACDPRLDDLNRLLMFYLLRFCHSYLEDSVLRENIFDRLQQTLACMPEYMRKQVDLEKD